MNYMNEYKTYLVEMVWPDGMRRTVEIRALPEYRSEAIDNWLDAMNRGKPFSQRVRTATEVDFENELRGDTEDF